MPRPAKPHNLKVVAGTARPDRITPVVELPTIDAPPPAPDWMPNAHAIREWDRLARILTAHHVIYVADASVKDQILAMKMDYAATLEEAFERAQSEKGSSAKITVIPDGISVIVKQ